MTSQGAQVDPVLLVMAKQRKLANGARTVDDPVQVKSKLAKVIQTRKWHTNQIIHFMRKRYPKSLLTQNSGPVLVPSLHR
jgi:hypothetical protein